MGEADSTRIPRSVQRRMMCTRIFAVDEVQAVSHAFEVVFGVGDDGAGGRLGLDSRGECEGLKVVEVGDFAVGFEVMLAVEVGGRLAGSGGLAACGLGGVF